MNAVLDNIRQTFLDEDPEAAGAAAKKVPTEAGERSVLQASEHLVQRVTDLELRKQHDELSKSINDSTCGRAVPKRRLRTDSAVPNMTSTEMHDYIEDEMHVRMRVTPWHRLDACFRWQKVREYVTALGREDAAELLPRVRAAMAAKRLAKVEYDREAGTVVRLNFEGI